MEEESPWKPLGDCAKGMHADRCFCRHETCDRLKEDKWCCHWFFLYWVPTRPMIPTEVLHVLRGLMHMAEFDYLGAPTSTGAFRMLVYVKDLTVLHPEWLDLIPRNGDVVVKESQAWRLSCCEEALVADWNYWRSLLKDTGGGATFWKLREGGGHHSVVSDLTDQVTKKIGYWKTL